MNKKGAIQKVLFYIFYLLIAFIILSVSAGSLNNYFNGLEFNKEFIAKDLGITMDVLSFIPSEINAVYIQSEQIKEPLFKLGRLGCLNFHPAPLPDYKSRAGYNTAILDRKNEFGVSVHFIDSEQFDAGPIIEVLRWPIDSQAETVLSLESTAQEKLFVLFKKTIQRFMRGEQIITFANAGGYYLTSKQLEAMKEVDLEKDSLEEIDRKIRAFFFPPYTGAYIRVGGQKITLVNQTVLDLLARKITK